MNNEQFKSAQELVQAGFFDLEETHNDSPIQVTYDYSRVTPEQANQLETIYNRVLVRHIATAYEDGKDLLEARNIQGLPYKEFIAWACAVFGWGESSVCDKINVALNWGITPPGGVIQDKAMYVLSRKNTPDSARQEAKALLTAGISITEDQAKEIRDRHKAELEELKEANQELQRSFDLFKEDRENERQEFENKIRAKNSEIGTLEDKALIHEQAKAIIDQQMKANAEEIAHLLEELSKQSEPERVEIDKFVTPPEVEAENKAMKERITALEEEQNKLLDASSTRSSELENITQERDNLKKEVDGLKKLANDNLFAETQTKYEAEVKDANRKMVSIFDKGIRDARALFPDPIDARQAYGGDEWARVTWMRNQALRFIEELDKLKESIESQFVDASSPDSPKFIEAPMTFIEAG